MVDKVSFAVGVVLAFSLAAPPGPMNAVIAEESVLRGYAAGFRAGLGALVSDAVFCALAFSGVAAVALSSGVRGGMALAGGTLMLYLAYAAVRDVRRLDVSSAPGESRGFRKALVLGFTNPYQIGWWLTVGVALVHPAPVDLLGREVVAEGTVALVGFFAGILAWVTVFPALLVWAEGRLPGFERSVGYASAAVLALFGVLFAYYSTTLLL